MRMTHRWLLAAAAVLLTGGLAQADGGGEYVLDASNWQKAEKLLPEPVLKRVKSGDYQMKVVPVDSAKFKEN